MEDHICPWRHAYFFDNWFRGLIHKPEKLFAGFLRQGQTALDIGCGMGFFSIRMARMVGDSGRVIAVDLQPEMLKVLGRRAKRKGVFSIITIHHGQREKIGLADKVDFALAFWAVHELPDTEGFFREIRVLLNPGGHLFIAEPKSHVSGEDFEKMRAIGYASGFELHSEPKVRLSRAVVLKPRQSSQPEDRE